MNEIQQIKKYKALEIKYANLQREKFKSYSLPSFSLGIDYFKIKESEKNLLERQLQQYIDEWFQKPEKYLRPADGLSQKVKEKDGFLSFPSLLDNSQLARFKYDPQPKGTIGRKVALIHIMHWNGRLKPYDRIISLVRNTLLPISTLIHIPAGRGLNPGEGDPCDYDSVSPNIGKTIFKARQDIQDIQFMARVLKEQMGYEEVGLFTYSVGSLRGIISSVMSPGLFDFGIFHMVADDFTGAILSGVATKSISNEIDGKINHQLLSRLWSTISPGSYSGYFSSLPKNTRIVQCKYDFVFGTKNVQEFNDKLIKSRPDINLEVVPLSHATIGRSMTGGKVMWDNIKFIYKHSKMQKHKIAALFSHLKFSNLKIK